MNGVGKFGWRSASNSPRAPFVEKPSASAADVMATSEPRMVLSEPVPIKRYANRRLYQPDACRYVTLDDLATMVEDDTAFTVREAATGEDITPSILQQITR